MLFLQYICFFMGFFLVNGQDMSKNDSIASARRWGGCFPGDALVTMEGGMKRMEDVVQGDRVLARTSDGSLGYSDVVMVMHGDSHVTHKFYIIHTDLESVQLRLTAEHMMLTQGPSDKEPVFKMARNVQIGDFVFVSDKHEKYTMQKSQVINIAQATFKGVYAPVTLEGTIIVDDVLASCYAYVEYQDVIHAIFWPVRALYKWFPMSVGQWKETKDIHWYPSILDTVFMPMLNTISVQ